MTGAAGPQALQARIADLEQALAEAEETLSAIRNGEVDAVVVNGPTGQMIYALENADRPYRVIVEQMKEGAVTLTREGVVLYANPSFAALARQAPERIIGAPLFDFTREHDVLRAMLADPAARQAAELTLRPVEGPPAPVNLSMVELRVDDGAEPMLCGVVTDLTHSHLRARELSEANARLAAEIAERTRAEQSLSIALDAADMASWELSLAGDQSSRSPRHARIFGHAAPLARWGLDEMARQFVPEDRQAVRAAFAAAASTGKVEFEKRIRRADDGALRWIHVKGRTFYGPGGPERITGVVVDVTDRRLIDEQLRQSQKMEAVGQLTGGIAHDFNNLLMIIGGSLEALSRRVRLEGRVQALLDAARLGVRRGAKLNEQLLAFARRQEMHEEVVCINDLLPDFETLLDRAMGERVRVELAQGAGLWRCRTDPHQLETAILNLAINARDAMDGEGALRLATANVTVGPAEAGRWEAPPGDYVRVSVSDTGCGMAPEVAARAFEPFFTTKGVGKGTGLGLSQVYGFATQSGGFVVLESQPGQGTSVSIHLPRAYGERPAAPRAAEAHAAVAAAGGSVLLVEDDSGVRATARAMLETLGYAVREAASGPEALADLEDSGLVDLVFSDVIMASGMTGVELARAIRREHPKLPVLLTSGYTALRKAPAELAQDPPLLRKPYTIDELAAAVSRALERAAG